jgi:hypothetical protein
MQKSHKIIGRCSNGHDVQVTYDLSDETYDATIGVETVKPLPDGYTRKPMDVTCKACEKLVEEHIATQRSGT